MFLNAWKIADIDATFLAGIKLDIPDPIMAQWVEIINPILACGVELY